MKWFFLPLMVFCVLLTSLFADEGSLWKTLNPQQQQQLSEGKPVVITTEVEGHPWPRFTIYHLVKSSPAQVAALFWDCEQAPNYVPNCLSVHIVSKPHPWVHDAQYTLKMPFLLPDEVYVSHNDLRRLAPEIFEISWKVGQGRYVTSSNGSLLIEPHEGKAILRYSVLVLPGSQIAVLLRTRAENQVIDSVNALVHQIEHEIQTSPQLMIQQLRALARALEESGGEPTSAMQ